MARLKTGVWLAAAAASGALALAAQSQQDGSAGSGGFLVQLPPTSPQPLQAAASASTTAAPARVLRTVGGFTYDWTELQRVILADNQVENAYIIVGNAADEDYLYDIEKGDFDLHHVNRIASASKWFTGALAMRMVQAGIVTLDDPMRPPLAFWTTNGTKKDVKLKHTLSMTSGFNANPVVGGCQLVPITSLYSCAKSIHDLRYDTLRPGNAPGAQYSYGPHGLQVAAAYLEAKDTSIAPGISPARQRNIHELFIQHVTDELDMDNTTLYDPSGNAPANPWIAGGAYSTASDYAKLLRAFLRGSFIVDMDTFTQQRTAGLTRLFVPGSAATWEYALGSFVECDTPAQCATSKINSSPGAYGWTGWIDRQTGYYALIATDIASGGDAKGVQLEQAMQTLIEDAIAQRTPAS